jgi:hypothetical protein
MEFAPFSNLIKTNNYCTCAVKSTLHMWRQRGWRTSDRLNLAIIRTEHVQNVRAGHGPYFLRFQKSWENKKHKKILLLSSQVFFESQSWHLSLRLIWIDYRRMNWPSLCFFYITSLCNIQSTSGIMRRRIAEKQQLRWWPKPTVGVQT